MRAMLMVAIGDVQQGRDPKHILRDEAQNQMVRVTGDEPVERR